MMDRIIIGNDHGGYEAKVQIVEHLRERGVEVTNVGSDSTEIVRYPHYVRKVAGAVARGEYPGGILICSTGIGMSMVANKIKGIRASVCTSRYMGKMTRCHNNSNVLCLGGNITGIFELIEIVDAWIENDFEGGRHCISLDLIADLEDELNLAVPEDRPIPEEQ
jgi:ribose 5-phosphate isomerase B